MKYCINCGKQLADDALFCTECGAKQAYPQQQAAYGTTNTDANYNYAAAPVVAPINTGSKNDGKTKEKKSGKKKFIVIPIVLLLLVALGVGAYFMFFSKSNKTKGTGKQTQVLDEYFEAITNMDFDAIYKLNSPDSDKRFNIGTDRVTLSELLTEMYHYPRSSVIDHSSYMLQMTPDIYLKSYGFPGYDEGGMDEYSKVNKDNDLFKEKFKDFKAEYELISMKNASECEISYGNGARKVDDMSKYIANDMDLEVEDVYVAKIHIKWSYGDKRYGFDETWWNDATFTRIMNDYGIDDGEKHLHGYKEIMDFYDNLEYDVFLYEVDGEWYIYNINMRENGYKWSVK